MKNRAIALVLILISGCATTPPACLMTLDAVAVGWTRDKVLYQVGAPTDSSRVEDTTGAREVFWYTCGKRQYWIGMVDNVVVMKEDQAYDPYTAVEALTDALSEHNDRQSRQESPSGSASGIRRGWLMQSVVEYAGQPTLINSDNWVYLQNGQTITVWFVNGVVSLVTIK